MKLLFIFGTRPEAIKLAPVILGAKRDPFFKVKVCITEQHKEMLHQVLKFFQIKSDYSLNIMRKNQSLFSTTSSMIRSLEKVLVEAKPDIVIVQGDTTTVFAGALSAFYLKIPVAHVEAGLRSYNKFSPFPEEMNRVLVSHIANIHFAPTIRAKEALQKEGINKNIYVVGNTVIDALFMTLNLIKDKDKELQQHFYFIDPTKKLILVTGHRRESFGKPFKDICSALKKIALRRDVEIVYPVHLNPNVKKPVFSILKDIKNVHLIDPIEYPKLIWLIKKSYIVLTDSGGIQEEAPSLGKPVLVMREVTERIEGIEAGTCKLIGTNYKKIVKEVTHLLDDEILYGKMANSINPYGDGKSSKRILSVLKKLL